MIDCSLFIAYNSTQALGGPSLLCMVFPSSLHYCVMQGFLYLDRCLFLPCYVHMPQTLKNGSV